MGRSFLDKDVYLSNARGRDLFHRYAKDCPIIDYHTHLPQEKILKDSVFEDLWELWLKDDHYKWRLMRATGIKEDFITGSAPTYEKFMAFASSLNLAPKNPVHHWVHLELQRIFGIDEVLDESSAKRIWDEGKRQLKARSDLSVRGLLRLFRVELLCTTDDPCASLDSHRKLQDSDCEIQVFPSFRLDAVLELEKAGNFSAWLENLEESSGASVNSFEDFLCLLEKLHGEFDEVGCRLSDHGLRYCPNEFLGAVELEKIFQEAKLGKVQGQKEAEGFQSAVLQRLGKLNSERGWAMQWHLGPNRNNSARRFAALGRDSGFDSMGDWRQTNRLIEFFSYLESQNSLPKSIVYNLNAMETPSLCCALQSFQEGPYRGKMQYGPAWWHLDHKEGILQHLLWLSQLGTLGTFVGMLTDSRSFTSYVRHEYFRRIFCDFIGRGVEEGEIPDDDEALKSLIENISYRNARAFFSFPFKY